LMVVRPPVVSQRTKSLTWFSRSMLALEQGE